MTATEIVLPKGPWSKSSLGTLLDGCSWQWALQKVFGMWDPGTPANAIGTAHHAAIEWHERDRRIAALQGVEWVEPTFDALLQRGLATLSEEWGKLEADRLQHHEDTIDTAAEALEASLSNWWAELRPVVMRWRPVAIEPYVREKHPASARGIHGFIDRVYWDPEDRAWVVVDDKTANGWSRWSGPQGHEIESGLYLAAALTAHGLPVAPPARMEWHIARKSTGQRANFIRTKRIIAEFDQQQQNILSQALELADETVKGMLFATNPQWNLCSPKWCFAYEGCQVTGELHPDAMLSV